MLAIIAPSFGKTAETFIQNHARVLAPRKTILLCQDGTGSDQFSYPVLSDIDSGWRSPGLGPNRFFKAVGRQWRQHFNAGLSNEDHRRVLAFFCAYRPRAALAEYGPTGCAYWQVCREAKVPLYVHFHGYDASRLLGKKRWIRHYRSLFEEATGIICPSKFISTKLAAIGCPREKLRISPNGVDPTLFVPSSRIPQRIAAVGRLVEKKAPHLTIAAFGQVVRHYPDARLDIIGDGPLLNRCRMLINRLKLNEHIHIHGAQDSHFVIHVLREASIFVQHSVTALDGDTEGFGISILEAMSSELPVVATRHNGFVETVVEGKTGLLVDERDVNGMAEAIIELLDDPVRAAEMGVFGRKRVFEYFTLNHSRDRLRGIMGLS